MKFKDLLEVHMFVLDVNDNEDPPDNIDFILGVLNAEICKKAKVPLDSEFDYELNNNIITFYSEETIKYSFDDIDNMNKEYLKNTDDNYGLSLDIAKLIINQNIQTINKVIKQMNINKSIKNSLLFNLKVIDDVSNDVCDDLIHLEEKYE